MMCQQTGGVPTSRPQSDHAASKPARDVVGLHLLRATPCDASGGVGNARMREVVSARGRGHSEAQRRCIPVSDVTTKTTRCFAHRGNRAEAQFVGPSTAKALSNRDRRETASRLSHQGFPQCAHDSSTGASTSSIVPVPPRYRRWQPLPCARVRWPPQPRPARLPHHLPRIPPAWTCSGSPASPR
jgi:hypothetical protein